VAVLCSAAVNEGADLANEIRRLIVTTARLPPESADIALDEPLFGDRSSLGLRSLTVFEIVVAVEERFDLSVPDTDVPRLNSIAAIVSYLRERAVG
jgi:acyl carrier protein